MIFFFTLLFTIIGDTMPQALVGMQNVAFSHDLFPITAETMGNFSPLPKETLVEIFKRLDNTSAATVSIVNWTCKEVVERNTEQGARKRFLRILQLLFKQGTFEEKPRAETIPHW